MRLFLEQIDSAAFFNQILESASNAKLKNSEKT